MWYILIYIYKDWLLLNRNINYNNYTISLIFILLTGFIFSIVWVLSNKNLEKGILYLLFICLIMLFNSKSLLSFYIWFEISVILILLEIILFGYRYKKYEAYYKLWIYSICGSLGLFLSIIYLYYKIGNLSDKILELYINYSNIRYIIFFLIILSLIIKLPSFPFHSWLTLAHVEASTIGSIILASIILKISIFGIWKYNIIILYSIIEKISPIIILIGLSSVIIISNLIINQIDLKLIIAYSSIIHTNYMLLGLLTMNKIGIYGGLISSLSHGLISSGLFLSIGLLYNRYKTRIILYYKGLSEVMVLFSICWFLLILSNMSLPLTSNFIGELCTLIGYFNNNMILVIILLLYLVITSGYNLILLNKLIYGKWSSYIKKYHDLSLKEWKILSWLIIINILFGIKPPIIF